MKKLCRFALVLLLVSLCIGNNRSVGSAGNDRQIDLAREIRATVDQAGQKRELLIPVEPLDFDTDLKWDFTIIKRGLSVEKQPAYFTIEETGPRPKLLQKGSATASGSMTIPKGTQYKITIAAGEYTRLLAKTGAKVEAKLKYSEALVKYAQKDQPYLYDFEIRGPAGLEDWRWEWGANRTSDGSRVTHQFERDGKNPVVVTGKGRTSAGETTRKFYFEFEVPPLIVLNPKIDPTGGPVELTVTAQANAVVNYGQKASYLWNFGDGVELSGPEAKYTYTKPGNYLLTLTATVDQYKFQKSWLLEVAPLTVNLNKVITPTGGPVPLEVKGSVTPKVSGGPTQLRFTWTIAGETISGASFTKKITEPGEYQVVLKTSDQLHPEMAIPDEYVIIQALPPQITLTPMVSLAKGVIPLHAAFDPGVKVEGSPVDLVYYWDFGDGEISNLEKPQHVYKKPGDYQARLTVSDRLHPGNLATATIPVAVLPPELKVNASAGVTKGLIPLTVNFNAQVGITGSPCEPLYIWDFGDGTVSYEQNPVHTFRREGLQTISLEVKDRINPDNVVKTTLEIETRLPELRLTASLTPTTGPAPLTVQGQAWGEKEGASNPNLKYTWDFGDGERAEGLDQRHVYQKKGTYQVTVTVEDPELGLRKEESFKVTVK
ncbi:MAG: PKD domain-containing protein [Firmicutes bacterium]|nr:PKD domain-containing protein [Bacillota bacterium]